MNTMTISILEFFANLTNIEYYSKWNDSNNVVVG